MEDIRRRFSLRNQPWQWIAGLGLGLLIGMKSDPIRAQEATVIFPFDQAASVVGADLGVRFQTASGSIYKNGVRDIVGNGRLVANLRFEEGKPVAIQPINISALMGRRALQWSFLFDSRDSAVAESFRSRRSVEVRGLGLSSVNESSLPWFPIDDSGAFAVDRVEFLAHGVISSEGTGIEVARLDLEDEWSFELDLEGTLTRDGDELRMTMGIHHSVVLEEGTVNSTLNFGGTVVGATEHPFAPPKLSIRYLASTREVRVSWEPNREFNLLQSTSPDFTDVVTHAVSGDLTEFRFPVVGSGAVFFRLVSAE